MRMRAGFVILASLALVAEAQINFGKSSASASFQGSVSSSANSRGSGFTSLTFGTSISSQGRGFARVEGQQAASNSFSSNNGGRFGGESSLVASFSSSCLPLLGPLLLARVLRLLLRAHRRVGGHPLLPPHLPGIVQETFSVGSTSHIAMLYFSVLWMLKYR